MEEKNLEQLKKLAKVFNTDNVITSAEVEQVLKGILSIMASFRKENVQLTENNKQLYIALLEDIKTEYQKTIETLENKGENLSNAFKIETKKAQDKFEAEIIKAQNLVKQLQSIQVKDGKDADEEVIVDKVLEKIKLPEYEEFILDDKGEQIVEEINSLPIEDKYKIDASHIKNLPISKDVGVGARFLQYLADVNISEPTDGQVLTYDSTTRTWRNENSSGGGGGGTPGGSDTQVQFNDGGSFGGDAGMTYNKTTDTLTLAGAINMESANIEDSDASHYLSIKTTSNLTANRDFTIVPGDAARTLTMAGNINVAANFTTSGANALTLTTTGATNVTLPTTGTLATLIGTESLSNKTLDEAKIINGGFIKDANNNELLIFTTTASAVNELTFANAATGNAPKFSATGGDTNISINFVPKGTGTLQVNGTPVLTSMTVAGTGTELQYRSSATDLAAVSGSSVSSEGYLTLAPTASTSGSPKLLTITGPTHTTLTASTEASDVLFSLARTVQFSTGALTNQRAVYITAPTYGFVGASTITTAATVSISGAPVAGTNATITNAYALDVASGITHVGGSLSVNGGSAGSPGLYFDLNKTAGFFSSTTGTVGFTASGSSRYTINSTDIRSTGTGFILTRNIGTDGLALAVTGDANTGVGMPGSDVLNLITGGVIALQANATQQVKIRAGSSTGLLAAVGGIMNVNTTAVGNVGTGEDDLMTYSIPASTLGTNGASIRFRASGTIANNVNAKRIRVKYGGTTVLDTGASGIPVSAAIQWVLEGEIICTGATTQKCNANLSTNNATLASYVGYSTAAETLSGAVTVKLTGEAVANNDIVQETMTVSFVSAI